MKTNFHLHDQSHVHRIRIRPATNGVSSPGVLICVHDVVHGSMQYVMGIIEQTSWRGSDSCSLFSCDVYDEIDCDSQSSYEVLGISSASRTWGAMALVCCTCLERRERYLTRIVRKQVVIWSSYA